MLLVGFVGLFFGVGETVFLVNLMDSILSEWNYFTLSNKETSDVHLTGSWDNHEFVLAAMFLTKHALNVEAIGRNFKRLWKSGNEFKIRDIGNHVVLFAFQIDIDAE